MNEEGSVKVRQPTFYKSSVTLNKDYWKNRPRMSMWDEHVCEIL